VLSPEQRRGKKMTEAREIENKEYGKEGIQTSFDPKIISFCCNWCGYSTLELGSVRKKQNSPDIGLIKVMCLGRIEPEFIFKALKNGADGVLVLGCHPGDCQFESGNYKTRRKILLIKKMLSQFGINPKRVRLEWYSVEKKRMFKLVVKDFIEEIKKIGPNPLNGNGRK
jgi:F420-non-reducing hydrogenase iron-sulfur subunit